MENEFLIRDVIDLSKPQEVDVGLFSIDQEIIMISLEL